MSGIRTTISDSGLITKSNTAYLATDNHFDATEVEVDGIGTYVAINLTPFEHELQEKTDEISKVLEDSLAADEHKKKSTDAESSIDNGLSTVNVLDSVSTGNFELNTESSAASTESSNTGLTIVHNAPGEKCSHEEEMINEVDYHRISNAITLNDPNCSNITTNQLEHSTGAIEEKATNDGEEKSVLHQSRDDIPNVEIVIHSVGNNFEMEITTGQNESGINNASTSNTEVIDLMGDSETESLVSERLQNSNTSEGFNRDIENLPSKDPRIETESIKLEMQFISENEIQIDGLKSVGSSGDSEELENKSVDTCASSSMTSIDGTNLHSATENAHGKNAAAIEAAIVENVHAEPESIELSPMPPNSTNDGQNLIKTPYRKRLATPSVQVQISPRTPRQRNLPARFLENAYSTPTRRTPRSTKKFQDKKTTDLPNAEKITGTSNELITQFFHPQSASLFYFV